MTSHIYHLGVMVLAIIGAVAGLMFFGAVVNQLRLRRHKGVQREAFVEEFSRSGIPSEISAAVYDHYRSLAVWNGFGVNPDDSYENVFHMIHDDIDEDAECLVQKLGMEMPIEPVLREWHSEIKTLRDMVLWLNWIRERQSDPA